MVVAIFFYFLTVYTASYNAPIVIPTVNLCSCCINFLLFHKTVEHHGITFQTRRPFLFTEGLSSNPGVWVFVDDSNIWIAAKQLTSRVKHLKTSEDHRVRIDVGKLTTVVAAGRPVAQGFLYGSEPPPVDTVWEKIHSQHFEVNTYRKSQITRKEKQVDAQLVADITERAIITPEFERTTIIVISGDADVLPAVKKVLKYK